MHHLKKKVKPAIYNQHHNTDPNSIKEGTNQHTQDLPPHQTQLT